MPIELGQFSAIIQHNIAKTPLGREPRTRCLRFFALLFMSEMEEPRVTMHCRSVVFATCHERFSTVPEHLMLRVHASGSLCGRC